MNIVCPVSSLDISECEIAGVCISFTCLLLILITCQRGKYGTKEGKKPLFIAMLFGTPVLTDFYQPLKEDELEQSTEVQIIFPAEQKPVRFQFFWEN